MMLNHYQQIKNVIVSHDPNPTGFYYEILSQLNQEV